MGDTNMRQVTTEDMHDESLKAFDELYGSLSPHHATEANEGSGDSIEDPSCRIDDEQKAQHQAKIR